MQKVKNKTAAIAIAIFLMLSMSASIMLVPNASAHSPPLNIPTYSYINVAPDPAGLGQTVTIGFWLQTPPPTAATIYGDKWTNMTVKVTHPDGTSETLGPFTSDDTGGTFTLYTPTVLGNYTFQMIFGGQTLAGKNPPPAGWSAAITAFIGDYYQPSASNVVTLTVQEEAIPPIPGNPFPSSYWTRPINAENNNWYAIGGNWLGLGGSIGGTGGNGWYNASTNYNVWTTAPNTAHILWTKPEAFGGTIGGEFGSSLTSNYYSTRQYERMFAPIIIQGILYYTQYPGSVVNPAGWVAADLHTGQTIWTKSTTEVLRCGQIINYITPNQFGGLAYLWSVGTHTGVNAAAGATTYNMYDALTGTYVLSIANGTTMTMTEDEGGNLIGYYVNSSTANAYNAPTLNMWNSSQCIIVATNGLDAWQWRPTQNAIIDFRRGIMWSKPLSTNISGVPLPSVLGIQSINSGVVIMIAPGPTGLTQFQSGFQIEAGYDSNTGAQLWITNRTYTPFTRLVGSGQNSFFLNGNGVTAVPNLDTFEVNGYSDYTGAKLWTTVLPDANPYDSLLINGIQANGTLYLIGLGGDVYALNIQTGAILWHATTNTLHGLSGSDTPYGVWPIWSQGESMTVADGKIYVTEGHEYSPPLFRGARELCLNITNGQLIWSLLGFNVNSPAAIADGVMTNVNGYDNQIYAFGKGPSKLTVTAPTVGVTTATPITITGTVTDISSGSQQQAVAANFPNGLPCVSDASMTGWMEFVYEQQPCPADVTGVPVSIDVLDSNGNYRNIGTTTSNADGMFAFTWTPDIPGDFTVIATFAGSESYYPSHADAAFYASSPAPTASPYPTVSLESTQTYIIAGVIAIIVVMIIIGALIMLMLRKRP